MEAGCYWRRGLATIANSLIEENNASGSNIDANSGGGLLLNVGAAARLENVTITGNIATGLGGGIDCRGVSIEILNSTIAFNACDIDNSSASERGGGLTSGEQPLPRLFSTIVAGNQAGSEPNAIPSDIAGALDTNSASNLIGVNTGLSGVTDGTRGNQIGTARRQLDPLLLPLAFNGGLTRTHALQPASPAIDKGDVTGLKKPLTNDGRDGPFARVVGAQADVGEFEVQAGPITLLVTTAADENDPVFDAASLSLREALRRVGADAPTIAFAPALNGQTLTLTRDRLTIDRPVDIQGPGAKNFTISGNNRSLVLFVSDENTEEATIDVKVSGLTLTNGKSFLGGAIASLENLTLDGMVITNNLSVESPEPLTGGGGGVFLAIGTLTVKNSTISNNKAEGDGGGIAVLDLSSVLPGRSALVIQNSTISGNQANGNGGGVSVGGAPLVVNNSTIAFNQADADNAGGGRGGGVFVAATATANMVGTIVAHNALGTTGTGPDISGRLDGVASLVLNPAGWDQSGSSNNLVLQDPNLGPLQDNGGPTPTHALLAGSPAIDPGFADAVTNPNNQATDQRGPGFPRKSGASIDLGAFEFNLPPPPLPPPPPPPLPPPPPGGPSPALVGFRQFAAGADAGSGGQVRSFNPDQSERFAVTPFPGLTGGVRVTAADFNADGIAELVVGTGPGAPTRVRVLDGADTDRAVRGGPVRGELHRRRVRGGRGRQRRRPGRPGHHPGRGRRPAGPHLQWRRLQAVGGLLRDRGPGVPRRRAGGGRGRDRRRLRGPARRGRVRRRPAAGGVRRHDGRDRLPDQAVRRLLRCSRTRSATACSWPPGTWTPTGSPR